MLHQEKCQRILVTGGAGFIGSHIVERLLEKNYDVTAFDNLNTGNPANIEHCKQNKNFHFVEGDIRDVSLTRKSLKDVDLVFHEAALANVTSSLKDPILTNQVNVEGTLNVLRACCDYNVKRFVYASSAAVYGKTRSPKKREDDTPSPTSPYGVSKLAAENYVRVFQRAYGLGTVCLRYFNVYGPRQRVDVHGSYGGVISIFINQILRNMPPTVHGDGEQTRDFVYIDDVVDANILAMNGDKGAGEAFNVATGKGTSINQVAETLKRIMNRKDLQCVHTEPRPTDLKHGYADISRAKEILGYSPRFSIEQGLSELVNWYAKKKN
jgi:nucleoside-diphosphate-sugar epimerase